MKLKTTIITSTLLSLASLSLHAAQELTPEKAAELKPFDRISITGHFNALYQAADAISRRADKLGADFFYIQDTNNANSNGGNWRVIADLYHKNAPKAAPPRQYTVHGMIALSQKEAYQLEPYDTVTIQGFYGNQPEVNEAIARAAKKKGAASFFIVRQVDTNQGGNQNITAFIYKADAPKRKTQSPNAIPADSDAGRAALAAGGAAAANVEIPGIASSDTPSHLVGRFFETQSTSGKRYTVTLPGGTQIQELNNITAAQMIPFDSVTISGHFNSMADVSREIAKRAAKKGAKYYHITQDGQSNSSGGNWTISADLFK